MKGTPRDAKSVTWRQGRENWHDPGPLGAPPLETLYEMTP